MNSQNTPKSFEIFSDTQPSNSKELATSSQSNGASYLPVLHESTQYNKQSLSKRQHVDIDALLNSPSKLSYEDRLCRDEGDPFHRSEKRLKTGQLSGDSSIINSLQDSSSYSENAPSQDAIYANSQTPIYDTQLSQTLGQYDANNSQTTDCTMDSTITEQQSYHEGAIKNKKKDEKWDKKMVNLYASFVSTCEYRNGNRNELDAQGYAEVGKQMAKAFPTEAAAKKFTENKLREKLKALVGDYKNYLKLKTLSGIAWDPNEAKFNYKDSYSTRYKRDKAKAQKTYLTDCCKKLGISSKNRVAKFFVAGNEWIYHFEKWFNSTKISGGLYRFDTTTAAAKKDSNQLKRVNNEQSNEKSKKEQIIDDNYMKVYATAVIETNKKSRSRALQRFLDITSNTELAVGDIGGDQRDNNSVPTNSSDECMANDPSANSSVFTNEEEEQILKHVGDKDGYVADLIADEDITDKELIRILKMKSFWTGLETTAARI